MGAFGEGVDVSMSAAPKSSILLSIFNRNGDEGLFTSIITESNKFRFADILTFLNQDEEGLIIYRETGKNWVVLSNKSIITSVNKLVVKIQYSDMVYVTSDLKWQHNAHITDKNEWSMLLIKDNMDNEYQIQLEKGAPYWGMLQVLHFLTNRQD